MLKVSLLILFTINIFAKDIVVICNKELQLDQLQIYDIRNLYLKKIKAVDSIKLTPVDNKKLQKEFNKRIIKKTPVQVNAYWAKMIFSGKAQPPTLLTNDKEVMVAIEKNDDVIKRVASDKSVIGYILKQNLNSSVKVLYEIN